MSGSGGQSGESLAEKLAAFLESHLRIIQEFETSLDKAAHFIKLAHISMEAEPEDTVAMLDQIREIGLLSHLEEEFQDFERMAGLLPQAPRDAAPAGPASVSGLKQQYERVVDLAQAQEEEIAALLHELSDPH